MESKDYLFRFDDVSINSNIENHFLMADFLMKKFPDCNIIWGISPLVHSDCGERVFPKILSAMSDYRRFFKPDKLGLPKIHSYVIPASHGLVHVDHRLLNKQAQELSILTSCNLINTNIFIPPFNKWDHGTELICDENGIDLIRFEDGWLSIEHNTFNPDHLNWYCHGRAFSLDKFKAWFK